MLITKDYVFDIKDGRFFTLNGEIITSSNSDWRRLWRMRGEHSTNLVGERKMTKKALNKQIKDIRSDLKYLTKYFGLLVKRINAIDKGIVDRKGKLGK